MSEDVFTKLQYQVRENSEELNDFLRDLNHWENDMKKKDKELSNPISDSMKLPPIRNQVSRRRKKKKKNVIEKDNGTKPKVKRIPGSDYLSWDKFDVDSALKEIDDNDKCKNNSCSSNESDTEEEELEIAKRKQKAILDKNKGNDFFKEGKYDEAISCYTSGMFSDSSNALLPANRAMAFLKKGNLGCAEKDCDLALLIDPTYVKAYLRRGAARSGLRKFELARNDFQKAVEFDPSNKQAKAELSKIEKELQKNIVQNEENAKGNEGHDFQSSFIPGPKGDSKELNKRDSKQNGIVMAVSKPPHRRSKKPLKRIEIKEVLSDSEDNEWEIKCNAKLVNSNDKSVVNPVQEEFVCKVAPSDSSINVNQQSSLKTDNSFPNEKPLIRPVPQTAYQFYTDWRALRKYPLLQFQYLKQLQPEQIPKLFKQSMDAEVFSDILRILKDHFLQDEHNVYQYLKHLTQIGRFGTLALFLSQEEQKLISLMLDTVKSSEECTKEEVHSLRQSFGIDTH